MRNYLTLSLIFLVAFVFSCENGIHEPVQLIDQDNGLSGTWGIYEYGYSPGAGYVIEDVPSSPLQYLSFQPNGTSFHSNYNGLEKFTHYLILDDPNAEEDILALFESIPKNPNDITIMELKHSYIIHPKENGAIELWFRFCIEGCHLGISKNMAID